MKVLKVYLLQDDFCLRKDSLTWNVKSLFFIESTPKKYPFYIVRDVQMIKLGFGVGCLFGFRVIVCVFCAYLKN